MLLRKTKQARYRKLERWVDNGCLRCHSKTYPSSAANFLIKGGKGERERERAREREREREREKREKEREIDRENVHKLIPCFSWLDLIILAHSSVISGGCCFHLV
jgi:hypothetical protein